MFQTCFDDLDERENDQEPNGEEASFHYMIMDLEHFINKNGALMVLQALSPQAQTKLKACLST